MSNLLTSNGAAESPDGDQQTNSDELEPRRTAP